jgi:hypothetical protein
MSESGATDAPLQLGQRREFLKPREVARAHDARVVVVACDVRVHRREHALRADDEALLFAFGHQHVVGRDAGLSRIERLAHEDAFDGLLEVRVGADDRGRLAAELQRHRREVLARGAHHVMADGGRAGEQQVIERQAREFVCRFGIAVHDGDLVLREARPHEGGEQFGKARREFRLLHHHAVARGQRRGHRPDRQVQRVVPRHHDAHHAEGLRHDARRRGLEPEAGGTAPRAHPFPAVAQRVVDALDGGEHLGQFGLLERPVEEVGADGGGDLLAAVHHQRAQAFQPVGAHAPRRRLCAKAGGAHRIEGLSHVEVHGSAKGLQPVC